MLVLTFDVSWEDKSSLLRWDDPVRPVTIVENSATCRFDPANSRLLISLEVRKQSLNNKFQALIPAPPWTSKSSPFWLPGLVGLYRFAASCYYLINWSLSTLSALSTESRRACKDIVLVHSGSFALRSLPFQGHSAHYKAPVAWNPLLSRRRGRSGWCP